jgi:hypothetical protein
LFVIPAKKAGFFLKKDWLLAEKNHNQNINREEQSWSRKMAQA